MKDVHSCTVTSLEVCYIVKDKDFETTERDSNNVRDILIVGELRSFLWGRRLPPLLYEAVAPVLVVMA